MSHWLGRPPDGATQVERWTGTEWVPDDGLVGLAFSGMFFGAPAHSKDPSRYFPYAWGPNCDSSCHDPNCPHKVAMRRTFKRFNGCSNGCPMVKVKTEWERLLKGVKL
jgi:hypothetical protein